MNVCRMYGYTIVFCSAFLVACQGCNGNGENSQVPDAGRTDTDEVTPDGDISPDATDGSSTTLSIDGLTAPVVARRDEAGVLHLQCETDLDCFAAQGYFHANDRFLQMDLTRNQTRGRLSTMIGHAAAYDGDVTWRSRTLSPDGEPLEEAYFQAASEETKEIFRAYSTGVNAWLENLRRGEHGARLSDEFDTFSLYEPSVIRPWEPEDCVTPFLQLVLQFESSILDRIRGRMAAEVSAEILDDVYANPAVLPGNSTIGSSQNAFSSLKPGALPDRGWFREMHSLTDLLGENGLSFVDSPSVLFGPSDVPGMGSNSWVVGPSLTASGGTLLSNDPHLPIQNPSLWYMIEMNSTEAGGTLHVAGASLPAGPGIVLGHNEDIAWGATVAILDLGDTYVETLSPDGSAVMRNGEEIAIVSREIEIAGQEGFPPRTATIEFVPGHGLIVARDEDAGTALSTRWVGQEAGSDLDFYPGLMKAKSVDEAGAALGHLRTLNVSWTVADRDGGIGWFPAAKIPDRSAWASPETPPWLPIPGDGSAEWGPLVETPTLSSPPRGLIIATNNDFDGSWDDGDNTNDARPPLQDPLPAGPSYRHSRIFKFLTDSTAHTPDSMQELLGEKYSVHGELIIPEVVSTADELSDLSSEAQSVVAALRDWDFLCPSGLDGFEPDSPGVDDPAIIASSSGCSAAHVLFAYLTDVIFGDELAAFPALVEQWKQLQRPLAHLFLDPTVLQYGEAFFDDLETTAVVETREDMVAEALELTGAWLSDAFGSSNREEWLWGRVHVLEQRGLLPANQYSEGPFATGGGYQTVDMADPVGGLDHTHIAGGSIRMVYELGADGVRAQFELPGGQVHHRDSEYYQNLIGRWLRREPTELLFDGAAVEAAPLIETIHPSAP